MAVGEGRGDIHLRRKGDGIADVAEFAVIIIKVDNHAAVGQLAVRGKGIYLYVLPVFGERLFIHRAAYGIICAVGKRGIAVCAEFEAYSARAV